MTMPTVYQLNLIKRYFLFTVLAVFLILFFGNILSYFFTKRIYVNPQSYIIKEGFPLFTSEEAYINFIRNYPYDTGVKLDIHKVTQFDTLWGIKKKYNLSIQTLIAANPHLKDLTLVPGSTIIIPHKNGTLLTFDNYFDVSRMADLLNAEKISGDYRPKIFRLISPDDIRIAFFDDTYPVIVNNDIEKIYSYKMTFIDPLGAGFYTSMYGDRVNPFSSEGYEFHNGVDIAAPHGTPIHAARKGLVFFSGWREGLGYTIAIQHDDGFMTLYSHCSRLYVEAGRWVEQNEKIGLVGSTGRSTGSHLHYTLMRHGQTLNPLKFLW